nr:hypothetical protein [Nitrospira moscoviensis]
MCGFPVSLRDDLKLRHGDLEPVRFWPLTLLLHTPRIALLRFVPNHFPEIEPPEEQASHRRGTPRNGSALAVARSGQTFVVQLARDGDHPFAVCTQTEDPAHDGRLLIIDSAFDMIPFRPAIRIKCRGSNLDVVIAVDAAAGDMAEQSLSLHRVKRPLLGPVPFALIH